MGIAWLVRNAESRGKVLGFNGIFGGVGIAAAGLLAGSLIDLFGWRAAFIVPGAISVATGLVLLACLRRGLVVERAGDRRPDPPPSRQDMLRAFVVLLLTMFLMGLIFQATQAALPKVFDLRLRAIAGEGVFGIGVIVAAVYLLGGLVQIVGGYMADRFPLKAVYLGTFFLQVPVLVLVAGLSGAPLIAAAMLAVMLSTGALPAENMLLARFTPERHHSLAFGVKFVLAFGAAPLAIWVVSLVAELTGEFVWLFAGMAVLAAASSLAVLWLPGDWRHKAAPAPAE